MKCEKMPLSQALTGDGIGQIFLDTVGGHNAPQLGNAWDGPVTLPAGERVTVRYLKPWRGREVEVCAHGDREAVRRELERRNFEVTTQ